MSNFDPQIFTALVGNSTKHTTDAEKEQAFAVALSVVLQRVLVRLYDGGDISPDQQKDIEQFAENHGVAEIVERLSQTIPKFSDTLKTEITNYQSSK
jgi:hypothetical protein